MPVWNESGADPVFVFDDSPLDAPVSRCIQNVAQQGKNTKYIVLGQRLDVYSVCRLLCQGVHGFLTYDQVNESLLLAIHSVQNGGMWVDSRVMQKYLNLDKRKKGSVPAPLDDQALTAREEEILHFTQQRLSNKEIAALLNIEVSTVKFHLSNIYSKLQIASRSDLWHNSVPQGLMPPFASNGRAEHTAKASREAQRRCQ